MKGKKMRKVVVILALVAMLPASAWAFGGNQGGGRRQGPPTEAIEACEGKSVGDAVEFTGRRGGTVEATCQEKDGQLVAVPEGFGKGRRGRQAAGQ